MVDRNPTPYSLPHYSQPPTERSDKMRSNTFLGFTTFGESHGPAMGVVIEDILPGMPFPYAQLQAKLDKRRPGNTEFASQRKETDTFQVISGVFEGKTTGMPICILFPNTDPNSQDYEALKNVFRPGHADYSWTQKFKIYDYRGGGRASGRETVCRVAAGALVQQALGDIKIHAYPISIGEIVAIDTTQTTYQPNDLYWPDPASYDRLIEYLRKIKTEKDSIGAVVAVKILNAPPGLGDPVFERLNANLAKAVLSIPGVKGIEFGDGFQLARTKGSESNDQQDKNGFLTNHQGGIIGGVSNGNPITFNIAIRPPSSIGLPQKALTTDMQETQISIQGRHDVCLVPRIMPVITSMVSLVLADAIAHQRLISQAEPQLPTLREAIDKIDEDIMLAIYRRQEVVKQIAKYKQQHNISVHDPEREADIMQNLQSLATELGLSPTLIMQIWQLVLAESKTMQIDN